MFKMNCNLLASFLDIDECTEQAHLCTPGGQCRNTQGGYMCVCNRGYKLDSTGQKCIGKPCNNKIEM